MCKQRKHRIMLKCQSNIASKPATGMQGYTVIKNKYLTSIEVVCALWDLSNVKITGHALLTKLTEPVELCQRDVILTLLKLNTAYLQMKTTCYMWEASIKFANSNRNFATWLFFPQKNA